MYWSVSVSDGNLDPVRPQVEQLLEKMRDEQRAIARRTLDGCHNASKLLHSMRIIAEVSELTRALDKLEAAYRQGTVFCYRDLIQPARAAQKQALTIGIQVLDQHIAENRTNLAGAEAEQRRAVSEFRSRISQVESKADLKAGSYNPSAFSGCLIALAIAAGVFFLIMYGVVADERKHFYVVNFLLPCLALLVVGLLWKPVVGFFVAQIPAGAIRSEIPRLKSELDRVNADAESKLVREKERLDGELERLKRHKEQCQSELKAL
jgi:hypothetical protein